MNSKWLEPYLKHLDKPALERLVAATLCMYDEENQLDLLEAAMTSQIAYANTTQAKLIEKARAVQLARLGIIDPKMLSELS